MGPFELREAKYFIVGIDNFVDNDVLLKVEEEIRAIPDDKFTEAIVQGIDNVTKNKLYDVYVLYR